MSQLTFGDSFPEELEKPKQESWYKARPLSHSSVGTYRTCPQKWKFRYVDKIPEKPRSYFSFGKSVHAGLEFLFTQLEGRLPELDEILNHYKSDWISEGYESAQQEKWFFQEGERILKGFYAKHKDDHKKVLKVELRFTIDIEGVPVTGFIDRVDQTPDGKLAIIDYKTGKAFDKSRVRKDPQLTLYQIACQNEFKKEVDRLTLYHLNTLTPITVPAHSPHMEKELKNTVVETAKGIQEGKFDPKPEPSGYCRWCDYLQVCPAFTDSKKIKSIQRSMEPEIKESVDRLGKLDDRIKELKAERNEVSIQLRDHLTKTNQTEMKGDHYRASLVQNGGPEPGVQTKPIDESKGAP